MPEPVSPDASSVTVPLDLTAAPRTSSRGRILAKWVAIGVLILLALIAPMYLSSFWMSLVFTSCAVAVGAIGLTMVTGVAGQMSLATPFFMVIGAITYVTLSSKPDPTGATIGLGWPPILGLIGGGVAAGVFGLAFSPIASRLRGIYLGMASLGLVFVSTYLLQNATIFTGGFNGRTTPNFSLFGIVFAPSNNPVVIFGVPYGQWEWLWYLGLVVLVLATIFARNVLRARPGRALKLIAAGDLPAAVAGVNVASYKAQVFTLSSMFAGISGVLYVLAIGTLTSDSFSLDLSLQFLAIVVIGGLGSIGGATAGSVFVIALTPLLQQWLSEVPALNSGSITSAQIAVYVYGAVLILVLIFKPTGLAGIWRSVVSSLVNRRARNAYKGELPS